MVFYINFITTYHPINAQVNISLPDVKISEITERITNIDDSLNELKPTKTAYLAGAWYITKSIVFFTGAILVVGFMGTALVVKFTK